MIQIDTKRMSWILRITAIAICLIALIFLLISGLLAKYVSSEEEGGGAKVANFYIDTDLSEFEQSIPLEMNPKGEKEIKFTVTNDSEVDVHFSVSMEFNGNLPLNMVVTQENSDSEADAQVFAGTAIDSSLVEWEGELKYSQSKTYKITVSWMEDAAGYQYAGGVGVIDLSVCAQQKE